MDTPSMSLKIAEVFAGIAGVTGGFIDAGGYEAVFLNDVDETARDAFVLNFPSLKDRYHLRSVEGMTGPEVLKLAGGVVDGLLGCPPCQGLSPAGLRSRDDKRNRLLREMRRLIWSIRPKFFVLENVPRLMQTKLYRDFEESLRTSYEMKGVVLNAAEYGIPQLRRRAVVVGFRKDLGVKPSVPTPTHGGRGRVFEYNTGRYVAPCGPTGRRLLKLRLTVTLPRARPLVTLCRALGDLPAVHPGEQVREYTRPAKTAYQRRMRAGAPRLFDHRAWKHDPRIVELLQSIVPGDCPRAYGARSR